MKVQNTIYFNSQKPLSLLREYIVTVLQRCTRGREPQSMLEEGNASAWAWFGGVNPMSHAPSMMWLVFDLGDQSSCRPLEVQHNNGLG